MLEILFNQLNNYFEREILHDTFVIENGTLQGVSLLGGQYFYIQGSILNDGLHINGNSEFLLDDQLRNETFEGCVSLLAVPKAVIELATEIQEWQTKNGDSPYTSESFGGYSYSKATGENGAIQWQEVFAKRMRAWRKAVR